MRRMIYAGIGSRETPDDVQIQMRAAGMMLAARGYTLRSGRADGADKAFETGCDLVKGAKVIRTASPGPLIDGRRIWLDLAAHFHPAWDTCSQYAKELHARNGAIVFGDHLNEPVDFVCCWTPGGAVTGGTGQALRIAAAYNVPVFNLAVPGAEAAMWAMVNA